MLEYDPAAHSMGRRVRFFGSRLHLGHAPMMEWSPAGFVPCVETPARIDAVEASFRARGWVVEDVGPAASAALLQVHSAAYLEFLEHAAADWSAAGFALPAVAVNYPHHTVSPSRPPRSIVGRMGYFAFNPGSPILEGTWEAARGAAGVALATADAVRDGADLAFGLCRPPGHHAGRDYGGGYCYLNNAALAADWLAARGGPGSHVAVVDLDYHHGNGTQDLLWERDDITYFSVHADPDFDFPYFTGRRDETGAGPGAGFTLNLPLPLGSDDAAWLDAITSGLRQLKHPDVIVVSLGLDTFIGDERFHVTRAGFREAGRILAAVAPLVVLLEGGYVVRELGNNAASFVEGALGWQAGRSR